ncbi:unnamed protein product [Dovyalis caffra]|uniref:Uncharacterized protein n=1 Tax=Dovyalis caffra TaxID=77055 RepID=A0AAV1ST43_9ROSI|nr:unnamed protein product [Dovyalis caffra]
MVESVTPVPSKMVRSLVQEEGVDPYHLDLNKRRGFANPPDVKRIVAFNPNTLPTMEVNMLVTEPSSKRSNNNRNKYLAQIEQNYAKALRNYYEAIRLEIEPYDRSCILYKIGLIHTSNGEHIKALEYCFWALE